MTSLPDLDPSRARILLTVASGGGRAGEKGKKRKQYPERFWTYGRA